MSDYDQYIEKAAKVLKPKQVDLLKSFMQYYCNEKDNYEQVVYAAYDASCTIFGWGAEIGLFANSELQKMYDDHSCSYKEYLLTQTWLAIRKRKLKSAGYKCQVCGNSDVPLEVHHNHYTKWGEEKDTDLIVLCDDCHEIYHKSGKIKDVN